MRRAGFAIIGSWVVPFAAAQCLPAPAFAGPAVNQFEVEGLDIEQGEVEINDNSDWSFGRPRRKFVESPRGSGDFAFDDNEIARQRHAVELGLGLTNWLAISVGFEADQERLDEPATLAEANRFGDLNITEIDLGATVVLLPVESRGWGLGAYAEYQHARSSGEASELFLGTILEAQSGAWSATANLALVALIGGAHDPAAGVFRDEKWDFAYFTQIKYQASERLALALEVYGTIDRIGSTGTPSEEALLLGDQDQHRIGPVLYYTWKCPPRAASGPMKAGKGDDGAKAGDDDDEGTSITTGLGVLFGLNGDTPDATLKLSTEVEF